MYWQPILTTSVLFSLAILSGFALVLLVFGAAQRLGVGLAFVLAMAMLDTLSGNQPVLHLGLALYPGDLMSLPLTVVTLGRLFSLKRSYALPRAWWGFVLVVMFSIATGLLQFGTGAGVQARDYYYFIVVAMYVASFEPSEATVHTLLRALGTYALCLALVTVYRWVVYYTPIPSLLPPGGVYNVDGAIRVIWSSDTMILAQALIAAFYFAGDAPSLRRLRPFLPALFALVLALQHRSVWVAVLAGVLASLFVAGRARSAAAQAGLFALMLALILVPLAFTGGQLAGQLGQSASRALKGQDTAADRLQGWTAMIKKWQAAGPRSIAIGNSFGTDNSRYVIDTEGKARKIDYFAHNMYVQTLFNTGLVGLGCFVYTLGLILLKLYRAAREASRPWPPRLLFVLSVMLMIYLIPYGLSYLQGLVFGTAMAWAAAHRGATPPVQSAAARSASVRVGRRHAV